MIQALVIIDPSARAVSALPRRPLSLQRGAPVDVCATCDPVWTAILQRPPRLRILQPPFTTVDNLTTRLFSINIPSLGCRVHPAGSASPGGHSNRRPSRDSTIPSRLFGAAARRFTHPDVRNIPSLHRTEWVLWAYNVDCSSLPTGSPKGRRRGFSTRDKTAGRTMILV
ncbi:hypothetical protein VTN00DRAFT_1242 [Thermoascus crustaceus]|uniref:uncharacterized protein n=1 Tax=Thermoascus crustaceus TaxID=5088 RepID=UPI0037448627